MIAMRLPLKSLYFRIFVFNCELVISAKINILSEVHGFFSSPRFNDVVLTRLKPNQSLHCRHPSGSERLHACARDARSSRIGVSVSDARSSSNVV